MTDDTGITHADLAPDDGQRRAELVSDFNHLGEQLARRDIAIGDIVERAKTFSVVLPSWGVGTGGTRFARFPMPGEPRNVFEKIQDCAIVHQLTGVTPSISLHFPWDQPDDPAALRQHAESLSISFDAVNSNTFQDQRGQEHSYKFGSLTHTDPAVRRQAIEHNRQCIEIGEKLGSKALTVWIGDGGNYPGQQHFRRSLDLYLESLRAVFGELPHDWQMYLEHKLYEPAFYSTVNK